MDGSFAEHSGHLRRNSTGVCTPDLRAGLSDPKDRRPSAPSSPTPAAPPKSSISPFPISAPPPPIPHCDGATPVGIYAVRVLNWRTVESRTPGVIRSL